MSKIKIQVVHFGNRDYIESNQIFYFNPPSDIKELLRYIEFGLTSGNVSKLEITKWNADTGERL